MTDYSNIDTLMEVVIRRTFCIVESSYALRREPENDVSTGDKPADAETDSKDSALVFPRFFHGEPAKYSRYTRISEQELRFAFVQVFREYIVKHEGCRFLYAVEVPTKDKYRFTDKAGNLNPAIDESGRSGSFDMVIYDDRLRRVCLIEFKANYPDKGCFAKDFLKLANPEEDIDNTGARRYFIHLVPTFDSKKVKARLDTSCKVMKAQLNDKACNVNYTLFSLGTKGGSEETNEIKGQLPNILKDFKNINFINEQFIH